MGRILSETWAQEWDTRKPHPNMRNNNGSNRKVEEKQNKVGHLAGIEVL